MNKRCFFLCRIIPLAFVFAAFSGRAQDSPRLDAPRRLANGAVDLRLTGSAGTHYALEASVNLSTWFLLSSGGATNGVWALRHDAASNYPALFYRGRMAVDGLPPLTVGLQLNTNTSSSSLVNISGGSSVLFGAVGTRYTLTIPSNSIPDARIFTMTEVTNISGLPFARGTIGAVQIEPADLVFWGAATLEITFRTNIDRRQIVSFASQSDGSAFRLIPDRVGTNRIMIPITRAGVYGSSVATAQELADAARREIDPVATLSGKAEMTSRGALQSASGFECQAAKKAAAGAAEQQIGQKLAARSQAAAVRLGIERQQQLLGATDDSATAGTEWADDSCDFYTTEIAPRWAEATSNCAFGKMLTQFALGLMRQRQLLGVPEDDPCTDFSSVPFCAMFKNCLDETKECCDAGNRGSVKVAEVLGLQRQDQLMGLNCISDAEAQVVIDACSSNVWTGTYSIHVNGHTNNTVTSSSGTTIQIDDYESAFEGAVIESNETGSDVAGYIVQLRVFGQISIIDFESRSVETGGACGGVYVLAENTVVAATNAEYHVSISAQPNGSYVLFSINRSPTALGVGAIETDIDLRITHSCDGSDSTVNKTKITQTGILGNSLPFYQGKWTDPNVISGTQTAADPDSIPALELTSQWNFSRRAKGP